VVGFFWDRNLLVLPRVWGARGGGVPHDQRAELAVDVMFQVLLPVNRAPGGMPSSCQSTLAGVAAALAREHYVLLSARDMLQLLPLFPVALASEQLNGMWDETIPQRDEHGHIVYPHKGTLVTYYALDQGETDGNATVVRSNLHNYDANGSRTIEHIDPSTAHGATSYFRVHKAWPDGADENPIVRGILWLVSQLLASTGPIAPRFEAMMSAFRVQAGARLPSASIDRGGDGDPSPEGVHQDSANLTIVMMWDRRNVAHGSGGNRVWSLEQPCGKPSVADLTSKRLLASAFLIDRFDTLIVLDREVKHEGTPITPADGGTLAVRDVLTFEVRETAPLVEGSSR
jgi:hypothetical protein